MTTDSASGMQIDAEIPYVPAALRPTKQKAAIKEEKDTIVVVGQQRQKKKRKAGELKSTPAVHSVDTAKEEPREPFDFSTVPNILDSNPDLGEGGEIESSQRKKRQKRSSKTAGTFRGDFPAPPKARSEVKSGNQSFTFGK